MIPPNSKHTTKSPHDVLRQTFGHDDFRGRQRDIIDRVMQRRHALVLMPTGGGKSLCYQVPALTFKDGLTLVLSPLIALMKDQVDALRKKKIPATYINSSLTRSQREKRYADLADGKYRILYVTPERFRKPDFLAALARNTINLLAVDEAHCISEWGHDFRPDYTRLADLRATLKNPTTIALTATATPDVQRDIVKQLGLQPPDIQIFHEGINRPNLALETTEVWGDDDKIAAIRDTLKRFPANSPGIVYFALIKSLDHIADRLQSQGVHALRYHGKLDPRDRKRVQNAFMSPDTDTPLVLATNAFGMGIDKADIRFVLHAEAPGSLESYYQEIGRAGRDGKPASCHLLYDERDLATQMQFIEWANPDAAIYGRVHDLIAHEPDELRSYGIQHLHDRINPKRPPDPRIETALAMLERHSVITLDTHDPGDLYEARFSLSPEFKGHLPDTLCDNDRLTAKRKRDQEKLLALVRYVRECDTSEDRVAALNAYFGLA